MTESFWEQVRRFPRWHQHEWLGASLMLLGLTYSIIGLVLMLHG